MDLAFTQCRVINCISYRITNIFGSEITWLGSFP